LRRLLSLLTISSALLFVTAAHADTVTYGSVPVTGIPGTGDSISFTSGLADVVGGVVSQAGNFILTAAMVPQAVYNFTFQDSVTVGGITELLTFSGQDDVTDTADTLTIFALGPINFGTATLDFQAVNFDATLLGSFPIDLSANVSGVIPPTVPEPSTLALSATGLLAFAGAARRKFLRS
jgi:hypothetical protein